MKLHNSTSTSSNTIVGYGPYYVDIQGKRYHKSVIVLPNLAITPWPVHSFKSLMPVHFEMLLAFKPEVVIFGSGAQLRFPAASLISSLIKQRIGVETMDFQAACRTYTILASEDRHVAAALLIETEEE